MVHGVATDMVHEELSSYYGVETHAIHHPSSSWQQARLVLLVARCLRCDEVCDSATVIYGMSAKNYGELTIIQLCKILTHGQVNFVTVQIIPTTFKMAHFVNHVLIFLFLIRHYITTSSSPLSSSVTLSLFHPWFKTFFFAEIFAFIDHWHLPDWPFYNWTCVQFKK